MELLNQTTQLSEEQTAASDKAYDEAAHALSNVEGLKLPNILPDELKNQSNKINEESKTVLQNFQEEVAKNKELLEEAQRVLDEAKKELQNAKAQQVVNTVKPRYNDNPTEGSLIQRASLYRVFKRKTHYILRFDTFYFSYKHIIFFITEIKSVKTYYFSQHILFQQNSFNLTQKIHFKTIINQTFSR